MFQSALDHPFSMADLTRRYEPSSDALEGVVAETEQIARMAEKVSRDIFLGFGWKKVGPTNQNWNCVRSDVHKLSNGMSRNTHPSDVVFYYDEPYRAIRTYVNTDLKSYASGSITKASIAGAARNLIDSVECANISSEWQELYCQEGRSAEVVGLLFVYNHSADYDRRFNRLLMTVSDESLIIRQPDQKVFVIGPEDIVRLNTIAVDMAMLAGRKEIPYQSEWSYFYPERFDQRTVHADRCPATLEMLLGRWVLLDVPALDESGHPTNQRKLVVYYSASGATVDEFVYLIDSLFHYQCFRLFESIDVRLVGPTKNAVNNFHKAKTAYARQHEVRLGVAGLDEERARKLTCESVTIAKSQFSEIELGLEVR